MKDTVCIGNISHCAFPLTDMAQLQSLVALHEFMRARGEAVEEAELVGNSSRMIKIFHFPLPFIYGACT